MRRGYPGALLCLGLTALACESCRQGRTLERAARTHAEPSQESAVGSAPKPLNPAASAGSELVWSYPKTELGPMRVVIALPPRRAPEQRFPVLVALHGRGEASKGVERGARAWVDDYALPRAVTRLAAPPLEAADLESLYDPMQMHDLNARLIEHPYRGLIVVCPYTPDILTGDRAFSLADPLARFIVDQLLPRVFRDTPALGSARSTGIDGVSLGGRAALLVGLARAEAFGSVAALQPAFDRAEASALAERAKSAHARNSQLKLRLLTSDGDFFQGATRAIAHALTRVGVPHEFVEVTGPHDYAFNRGPGVYEMLVFHDRALRAP
ncbi:MAG TPA: alpha/beta hydrolase-fold protein [Polyangiaceae bacterium]|nr:alpha/beta hydrolase-fold protein [Polyangiaceae bacterium]